MSIYDLQAGLRTPWSLVAVLLLLVASLCVILFSKLFRRNPPGLVWRTFADDRGVPNMANITLAVVVSMLVLITIVALCWPTHTLPDAYVAGWFGLGSIVAGSIAVISNAYYKAGGSTDPPQETDGNDGDYSNPKNQSDGNI